jgi:hypothetical protein
LHTPIEPISSGAGENQQIYVMLGQLCLVYGSFVSLLILMPNRTEGRGCFLFCGGIICAAGLILRHLRHSHRRDILEMPGGPGVVAAGKASLAMSSGSESEAQSSRSLTWQ